MCRQASLVHSIPEPRILAKIAGRVRLVLPRSDVRRLASSAPGVNWASVALAVDGPSHWGDGDGMGRTRCTSPLPHPYRPVGWSGTNVPRGRAHEASCRDVVSELGLAETCIWRASTAGIGAHVKEGGNTTVPVLGTRAGGEWGLSAGSRRSTAMYRDKERDLGKRRGGRMGVRSWEGRRACRTYG